MESSAYCSQLQSMFPNVDLSVIASVLKKNKNNLRKSVDELLLHSEATSKATPPAKELAKEPQPWTSYLINQAHQRSSVMYYQPPLRSRTSPSLLSCDIERKKLIILRGLPGSGKTTVAKQLKGYNGVICSTDDYFITGGRYVFDQTKISENHQRNQDRAYQLMKEGKTPIIIDNTNTTAWEMKPYVTKALERGYDIEFREPDTSWKFDVDTLERRNIHGVGREVIERMKDRYERDMTVEKVLTSEKPEPRPPQYNSRRSSSSYFPVGGGGGNHTSRYRGNYRPYNYANSNNHNNRFGGNWRQYSDPQTQIGHPQTQTGHLQTQTGHPQAQTVYPQTHSTRPQFETSLGTSRWIKHETDQDWGRNWSQSEPHIIETHSQTKEETSRMEYEEDILNFSPPASEHVPRHVTTDNTQYKEDNTKQNELIIDDSSIVTAKLDTKDIEKFDETVLSKFEQSTSKKVSEPGLGTIPYVNSLSGPLNELLDNKQSEDWTHSNTDNISDTNLQLDVVQQHVAFGQDSSSSDLEFLQSCFTHFSPTVLQLLYERSQRNLSAAVDLALHMPLPNSEATPTEDGWTEDDVLSTTSTDQSPFDVSYDEAELLRMKIDEEQDGGDDGGDEDVDGEDAEEQVNDDSMSLVKALGISDAEYAQALQTQLQIDERSITSDIPVPGGVMGMRPDHHGMGMRPVDATGTRPSTRPEMGIRLEGTGTKQSAVEEETDWDDSNLLLKLTPSLARQLQTMFGNISSKLMRGGLQNEDNLIVLLNENVAKGIYQKWKDTLEARKIECEFSKNFKNQPKRLEQTAAGTTSESTAKKRKRHRTRKNKSKAMDTISMDTSPQEESKWAKVGPTNPTPMNQIINEQIVEQIGQEEVNAYVEGAMEKLISIKLEVQSLYKRFPSLAHSVIHWYYYKTKFHYDATYSELSKIASVSRPTYKPGTVSRTGTSSTQNNTATRETEDQDDDEEIYDYNDLRAEAAIHAKLRAEAFQKAAEARGRKQGELAMHYAQQGHLHTERMKDANRRAAEMTFRMKNKGRPNDTLDLHCLHVSEALQALSEKLNELTKGSHLFVITGRGLHSSKGVAKLKPAVIDYLKRGSWKYEEVNAGLIKVTAN